MNLTRHPSWEEYKEANKRGAVRANKSIAAQVMYAKAIPLAMRILYAFVTLWTGFLIFPATVTAWFVFGFSAWWIFGSVVIAWFLVKVSREGHCEGMKLGAERDEKFYESLVQAGAFLFEPPSK